MAILNIINGAVSTKFTVSVVEVVDIFGGSEFVKFMNGTVKGGVDLNDI